jgi:hypothetical protein
VELAVSSSEWRSKAKLPNLMVEGFTEGTNLTTGESKMSLPAK